MKINQKQKELEKVELANKLYNSLKEKGIEAILDDRENIYRE